MSNYGKNNVMETAMDSAEMDSTSRLAKRGTVVNAPFVKIRKEPVNNAEVLEIRKKGDRLKIKKLVGDYYMVEVDGHSGGYILTNYLEADRDD